MQWKTHVSGIKNNTFFVRGVPLTELVTTKSFSQAAFLLLTGKTPTDVQTKLFDAVLVAMIDHGAGVPTAFMPRVSVSVGNPMNAALAAGLLGLGDHHGGALEGAMRLLYETENAAETVAKALAVKARLPGYGHKVYKDVDPRAQALLLYARSVLGSGKFLNTAEQIGKELSRQKPGSNLPLNIDGAVAAILCEIGLEARLGKGIFALARLPGMMAHALEEMTNEKPYRRFEEEEIEYLG